MKILVLLAFALSFVCSNSSHVEDCVSLASSSSVARPVEKTRIIEHCRLPSATIDDSRKTPSLKLDTYRVNMKLRYGDGRNDSFVKFTILTGKKTLRPWQAYASFFFTGGMVLYAFCANGFMVDNVLGDVLANPRHFGERGEETDMAQFDPENAAAMGKHDLQLAYTCIRRK